jgi:hypothetical protein
MKQPIVTKAAIRRLRLKDGDIIVVKSEQSMRGVMAVCRSSPKIPKCSIIVALEGIKRLDRSYLRKVLGE